MSQRNTRTPAEAPEQLAQGAASEHWASMGEAGASLGMRFLLSCYKLGGAPLFKLFLAPVILYFFLFRREARAQSLAYIARMRRLGALPGKPSLYRQSFAHFWQFALAIIDKFGVWMGRIRLAQVRIHNDELITELHARERGAIFLMSHLGNFEICRCLSSRHRGLRLTVLMHTKHAEKFNRLLQAQIDDANIEIIQVTQITPATAMMLSERVDNGELIAIAGDRVAVNYPENCLVVDFLGDKAPMPLGPFMLASILRCPLIALFCLKEQGQYQLYFEQLSSAEQVPRRERQAFFARQAQQYASRLEYYCRREPLQWFNFFNFWQLPKAAELKSPARSQGD